MKTKHTPGPWEFNKDGIQKFKHGFITPMVRTSVGMNHICSIHQVNECWLHPDKADEAIANAKLIAAAPDVLEALKAIVNAENADKKRPSLSTLSDLNSAIENAKDIIKKATE